MIAVEVDWYMYNISKHIIHTALRSSYCKVWSIHSLLIEKSGPSFNSFEKAGFLIYFI